MTIADGLIILATLLSPFIAVQSQKWIEHARRQRDAQQHVFEVLMATRATRLAPEHVNALNRIDIDFGAHGRRQTQKQTQKETEVINRWRLYADQLNLALPDNPTDAQLEAWAQRRDDLFIELLFAMSESLGYTFDRVQLRRAVYRPQGHNVVELRQDIIQRGLADIFSGNASFPMSVTDFPVSQEAFDLQKAAQQALISTIKDGAVHIKEED
jgi:hypothetical protein